MTDTVTYDKPLGYYVGMGVVLFVLIFGFPAMCLLHVLQGKAGCLWLPLLVIAQLCVTMGLSTTMSCCARGGNLK